MRRDLHIHGGVVFAGGHSVTFASVLPYRYGPPGPLIMAELVRAMHLRDHSSSDVETYAFTHLGDYIAISKRRQPRC